MARHRKPRDQRHNSRSPRRAAALRDGIVGVTIALCLVGSIKLFASASAAAGGAQIDSLGGWRQAGLAPPAREHPLDPLVRRISGTNPLRWASPQQVSGQSVTAVGDSIMVASTPALQQALPGIYIDAAVGRQFSTGLQVIAGLRSQGLLRPVVIVGLGTNGTITAQEMSRLFAEIGSARRLVLVNTFEPRPWQPEVNATIAAAAAGHPGVVLADWHSVIEHRTSLLWPDGIHPQPGGGIAYAAMIKAALERLANPAG